MGTITSAVAIYIVLVKNLFAQDIIVDPKSTIVFLNQLATFTCVTNGDLSSWLINGTLFDNLPIEIHLDLDSYGFKETNGDVLLTLVLPARAKYNETVVQCLSIKLGKPSVSSVNASLLIQGIPSEPKLMGICTAASITLWWTAPFSLDVTDVDPDLWYFISILNTTDRNNPKLISCFDCINITDSHYTFTPHYLASCNMYSFSVMALNGAGFSESSSNLTISHPTFSKVLVKGMCDDVAITFQIQELYNYTQQGISDIDVVKVIRQENNHNMLTYVVSGNKLYQVMFKVLTTSGYLNVSQTSFSTYDVQEVDIKENGGGLIVSGKFIKDSRAAGCLLLLNGPTSPPHSIFRVIQKNKAQENITSTIITGPPAMYAMYVYDLEDNGLPNSHPALVKTVLIKSGNEIVHKSNILRNASILETESKLSINCEFFITNSEDSCVLIYGDMNNTTLKTIDITQKFEFPVSVTIDSMKNYTYALFGKSHKTGLEEEPLLSLSIIPGDMNEETEDDKDENIGISHGNIAAITGATSTFCLICASCALLIIVIARRYFKYSSGQTAVLETKKVEYEEVDLPLSIPDSIDTQPNTAYVTLNSTTQM